MTDVIDMNILEKYFGNSKKIWTWIGIAALILIAVFVFGGIGNNSSQPATGNIFAPVEIKDVQPIKIGAILPLTGDLANYGENVKDGINLLSEEINAKGGIDGKKVVVIFEDSKGQPDQGVAAIQKLIGVDNVTAIIGDVASSPTLAFAPIANKNKLVVVSPSASSPDITNAGQYIYRVWPSDIFESSKMTDYIKEQNVKSVALLYINNDYGRAMAQEIKKRLGNSNIVVTEESFDQDTTDVRAQLTKIKDSNPEYLYLIGYAKDSIVILRQYKEMGLKSKLLATSSSLEDPQVLKEVGDVVEGIVYTSPIPSDATDPIVAAFIKNYEARYGKKPGLIADYGYDSLNVILESMELSGDTSKDGVFKGIQQIKDVKGATGLINFDENGDVMKPSGIKTIKNGTYVWLEK